MTDSGLAHFERPASFYLGKKWDDERDRVLNEYLLYDANDLTTHAAVVGMTGSGKTGLCISLLEEAALDGVPAIVIDPKGDISNMLLTFPNLSADEFEEWIDPGEASRKGRTVREHAEKTAAFWKDGLEQWGEGKDRVQKLQDSADFQIYTPGSLEGHPINILASLRAPMTESEGRDRLGATTSALLGLVGEEAEGPSDPKYAFLSALLMHAWSAKMDLSLQKLVRWINEPPFSSIGVMDLESFFPQRSRQGLALRFNGLVASPTFAAWTQGDPLDIARMLRNRDGKNRVSILSISHLNEEERMFFVTLLLGELLAWTRKQSGTTSLRALLYMDEVFGYLPPTKNPPSKELFLTLLKQARAFGVGLVLATQNPVDVDYKALSNCGTWFVGRLQTAQDVDRLMDGLRSSSGVTDTLKLRSQISGLDSRVFLMKSVHEDEPIVFHTRWAMSYLRGPLTLPQIAKLTGSQEQTTQIVPKSIPINGPSSASELGEFDMPAVGPHVEAGFVGKDGSFFETFAYLEVILRYSDPKIDDDFYRRVASIAPIIDGDLDLDAGEILQTSPLDYRSKARGQFQDPPECARTKTKWKKSQVSLKQFMVRADSVEVYQAEELGEYSRFEESENEFRDRLLHIRRERRDEKIREVQAKYEKDKTRLESKILRAEQKVETQAEQVAQKKLSSAINIGGTILGALLGSRALGGAKQSMRSFASIGKEKQDVERAKELLERSESELKERTEALEKELALLREQAEESLTISAVTLKPKRTGIDILDFRLLWLAEDTELQ